MTIIRGVRIVAAPCCGARYAAPRYLTMNFMADAYWTDGWRDGSLMPNDPGPCRCVCGRFILLKELVQLDTAETSDLPPVDHVYDEGLRECIAQADHEALEVAARLAYWRYLNHPYRRLYRLHRDTEEAATRAAWEAANPDCRTLWDKFRGRKEPVYRRPPGSPLTYPAFEATNEQLRNMERLSEILLARGAASHPGSTTTELAELYREQGRFDEAEGMILILEDDESDWMRNVISKLIEERQPAPLRYGIAEPWLPSASGLTPELSRPGSSASCRAPGRR